MKKLIFALLLNTLLVTTANAQTDYTSRITNPSFEQGTDGWKHKGMGAQGNSVFDIKDGTTTVTVRGRYTVAFNFVAGSISIGFDAPAHPPTTGPCSTTSASSSSAAAALPLTSTHPLPQMLNQ